MKINTPRLKDTNIPQLRRISYSVLIAFIFWFFIKSEDDYLVTQKIPLVARNLQEQKTYKEEVPRDILVTIKGSGRSFIWLALFENFYDDYKAIIDLSSTSQNDLSGTIQMLFKFDASGKLLDLSYLSKGQL